MADRDRYDETAEILAFEARAWKTEKGAAERIAVKLRLAAEEARREEREACAKVADAQAAGWKGLEIVQAARKSEAQLIAQRIRARGGSGE